MKQGWEVKKLNDVCSINYGTRVVQKKDGGSTYPVYGGGGATFKMDKYNREDCLIVSRFAMSPQCVRYVQGKFFLNDSGLSIDSMSSVLNQNFLDKHIIALNDKIYSLGKGAAQRNLDVNALKNIDIHYPMSLAEQEKIVAELDCLSGIIEKKKQQLKEYDALAQSIFYEMFGNVNEFVPLAFYIGSLSAGKSLAGEDECLNKVLKTGAVTYDYFDGKQVKNLPLEYTPIESHKVKAKDVLISRMNTAELVGACAYVWNIDDCTYLPDRLWRAELMDNSNPIYLWKAITTDKAKEQIRNFASGTSGSMKNISKSSFLKVQIPKVSQSEQQEFASKIEAIEKQKELIKQSIVETETLFNSRMDFYFN